MLLIKCRSITNLARVCQVFPSGYGVKSQQCKSEPDRNWLLKKEIQVLAAQFLYMENIPI
jgi:hypothetical protein